MQEKKKNIFYRIGHKLKTHFIAGIIAIVPISVSFYLIWWMFKYLDNLFGKYLSKYIGGYIYGIGFIALFLIIWLVGFIMSSYLGRKAMKFGENILHKIPVLNVIFKTTKEISQRLLDNQIKNFKQAVILEVFNNKYHSIGFITSDESVYVGKTKTKMVHVFIPTAPNPTSGFLILVEENKIQKLDMPIEEAFKAIVSAGMIYPGEYK